MRYLVYIRCTTYTVTDSSNRPSSSRLWITRMLSWPRYHDNAGIECNRAFKHLNCICANFILRERMHSC
jgi:hypothetical protein